MIKKDQLTIKDILRQHHDDLPSFDNEPLKKLFEPEEMPDIDESQVGKIRLIKALMKKFGPDYKSNPEVRKFLEHYEKETKFINHYKKILGARYGR